MARLSFLRSHAQSHALPALLSAWLTASILATACVAAAQEDDEAFSLDESETSAQGQRAAGPRTGPAEPDSRARARTSTPRLDDEQALQEERAPDERFRESTDPYEDPAKTYLFFGAGYRFSRIPTWLLGAYRVEEGPAVSVPVSFSGELAYRKKGFQVTGALNFTKLKFHGPYQLKGDPITDTEWLQANFKTLNLTVAVTWSTAFTDWFSLEYGVEAGLGFLFGDLLRSEAYKAKDGRWGKCPAWASQTTNTNDKLQYNPKFPNPTAEQKLYCDVPVGNPRLPPPDSNTSTMDGAQYGVTARHGLFHGGVPHVIPILGPRLSLRFKPIHQVVLRVDVPLPVIPFGFMGGITAQYGL